MSDRFFEPEATVMPTGELSQLKQDIVRGFERVDTLIQPAGLLTVDGRFVDSAACERDGSPQRPYRTIQAAVDAISARGDNGPDRPYVIEVKPGIYNETVRLEHEALKHISLVARGDSYVGLDVGVTGGLVSTQMNNQLRKLSVVGINLASVTIAGADDGGAAFSTDMVFKNCLVGGDIDIRNVVVAIVIDCKIGGDILFQNIPGVCQVTGEPGQNPGKMARVVFDMSAPKPAGASETYAILDNTVMGAFDVQRLNGGSATVQLRKSSRIAHPYATSIVGAGCVLKAYSGFIRGKLENNGTAEFYGGAFVQGDIVGSTPTYVQRASQLGNDSDVAGHTIQDALNTLHSRIAALGG